MTSDTFTDTRYTLALPKSVFNELMNFLSGCSEYFTTTSDSFEDPEEMKMYYNHAIELRNMQSEILSVSALDGNTVLMTLTPELQSALVYDLITMLPDADASHEPIGSEEPSLFRKPGTYLTYPLYDVQFSAVLSGLTDLVEQLQELITVLPDDSKDGVERQLSGIRSLKKDLLSQSYTFREEDTDREMTALTVRQEDLPSFLTALLAVTAIPRGNADYTGQITVLS